MALPKTELMFHRDPGSEYTSKYYKVLLKRYGICVFMVDIRAGWDNAVVDAFLLA
ncbi:MAG: putative transposase [Pseudohongiellaceae bacterium]|jgi:putative transposase